MTYPHAHKVTQVLSPSLEVPPAIPPVASLSQMTQLPLFEEAALPGVAMPSGVYIFGVSGVI